MNPNANQPTVRGARLEALLKANAAPRCGARSKRTGKPCRGAAMQNGRCKLHGGKSTGPRTPEGLERSRRANWKHCYYSHEAKVERSRVRAAMLAVRYLRDSTLQRKRTGGNQHVTVKHIHQQVNVTEGGQAVVAGDKVTSGENER